MHDEPPRPRSPATRVRLELRAQTTLLVVDDAHTLTLAVGARGLAETVLRHEPPSAVELERAIDLVEDALAAAHDARLYGGELVTADPWLITLPGLERPGAALDREDVEALFQRLASRALGTPVAAGDLPHGRELAAALLILRECMHHLGLRRIGVVPG